MSVAKATNSLAVVTASPPGENGVGQNYIRDLLATVGDQKTTLYAILKDGNQWRESDRQQVDDFHIFPARYESPKSVGPGFIGRTTAAAAFALMTQRHAKKIANQISAHLRSEKTGRVLIVVESPLLMLIAETLCKSKVGHQSILVWDHPNHVASAFGHSGWRSDRLMTAFESAVSNSNSAITVAKPLQTLLNELNPQLTTGVFRCPVDSSPPSWKCSPNSDDTGAFVIGFAGSVTAPDELELLQTSLDRIGWVANGRPLVLRLFGKRFTLSANAGRNVEYRGFLPTQADVVRSLSQCDLCFLPQPFSNSRRLVAEYSFPTKLSTYLASHRPVLVLAPDYASLTRFQSFSSDTESSSSLGFTCQSNEVDALSKLILGIVTNDDSLVRAQNRAVDCARHSFQTQAGATNVRNALGIA